MDGILKQSTAVDVLIGPFVDSTDGYTAEEALSPSVLLSKNGQTLAAKNDVTTPTHDDAGYYNCELDATDTNTVGQLVLIVEGSATALPVRHSFQVVEESTYDALFGASATGFNASGRVDVGEWLGNAVTHGTGGPDVNVNAISDDTTAAALLELQIEGALGIGANVLFVSGDQTAADNLEAMLDGTGGVTLTTDISGASTLVDDVWDEVLTVGTHNVGNSAGRRLRNVQDFGIYDLGAVWVDEVGGTSTGTTDGEDATVTNRADDFDNAQTVADSVGLHDIRVTNGNSITLSGALEGYDVYGNLVTIALGGQNIGATEFIDFQEVTGTGTSTGGRIVFNRCDLGNCTLPGDTSFVGCGISGTITIGSAGDMVLVDCYSEVPGVSSPVIDMGGAIGATNLNVRRYSGGLTLNNVATGDVVSVEVVSSGTITINGTGGTVHVRGICAVSDGSGGAVTIVQTQAINLPKIKAELVDCLNTDTYAEPGQGAPPATPTIRQMIHYVYKAWRNRNTTDATNGHRVYADDGTTVDHEASVSDDGTTFDRGEFGSG